VYILTSSRQIEEEMAIMPCMQRPTSIATC
jgi:hypothetical protein